MDFDAALEQFGEYGVIDKIIYPIARATGLPNIRYGELVVFENGGKGEVFSLHAESVDILLFGNVSAPIGSKVARTGEFMHMDLCKEILGGVIDPYGSFYLNPPPKKSATEQRDIDFVPCNIEDRALITEPFYTGYSVVDSVIPLGKGQRELVLGDEKTGKTSFLLGAMQAQVQAGGYAVYAVIGGKRQEVTQIMDFVKKQGIADRTVIVFSPCDGAASDIYYTPYAAMTAAEYIAQWGDVLVVLDDLTTHAKYYREMALLAGKYPGRDSYPGDMFYTHSRMLERAGALIAKDGKVRNITCLPVGHTNDSEVTDYIVSNLISITDGHLLFDTKESLKGRTPPVHIGVSVSRVGKQTRRPLYQDVGQSVLGFLTSQYEKAMALSHFGEEMTPELKDILKKGDQLYRFFNQSVGSVVPPQIQAFMVALIFSGILTESEANIEAIRDQCITSYQKEEEFKTQIDTWTGNESLFSLQREVENNPDLVRTLCKLKKI